MKNKEKIHEIIRYLIVGVLTTLVSLFTYYALVKTVLNPTIAMQLQIANVISWVISVIFAYITNRIFVFRSKSTKKLKEIASFVGSRIITLIMDMGIMFLGVTLLNINNLLVKLASQGIVIVANYLFSKIFVFNETQKPSKRFQSIYEKIIKYFLFSIPILEFIKGLNPEENRIWISYIYIFLMVVFILDLWFQKKHRVFLSILLTYLLIEHLYLYCKGYELLEESIYVMQIFILPVSLLYFYEKEKGENKSFQAKLFFLTTIVFFLSKIFHQNMEFSFGFLLAFLPIIINILIQHKNYIAIFIGLIIIGITLILYHSWLFTCLFLLSLSYIIFKNRQNVRKEKIVYGSFLMIGIISLVCMSVPEWVKGESQMNNVIASKIEVINTQGSKIDHANIDEQLFGINSIEELDVQETNMDICDILNHIGMIGLIFYIGLMSYTLQKLHLSFLKILGIIAFFIASVLNGPILVNAATCILTATLCKKDREEKRKILLVSNMYPGKRFKHYGSFVKNTKESLEILGFQVEKAVKKKQTTIPGKIIGYTIFYIKAFYKSIFNSYDYIYVHFISLSTFPVILGKITSRRTELILNAHGNDIVPDYDFEIINVKRSKFSLKFADKIIVPSKYFKDVLKKEYHINEEKIMIYPSGGINFDLLKPKNKQECKQKLGLEQNISYFGYVSRIEKDKGWDTLLEAWNKLKKEGLTKNTKLLIIGSGSEQEVMDIIVKKYKLENDIIQKEFVHQKDLVDYYNAMDVLLYPTKRKSESLGLVGLEAMACKTPVIGCVLYGPREYLKEKENALTFKEDKTGEILAKKIKEWKKLKEKELQKMIENAYITSLEYDREKISDQLKEIFLSHNNIK